MRQLAACMLCFTVAARAEPATTASPATLPEATAPASALPLRARLDRDTIRAAIAGLPDEKDPYPRRHEADTISATPLESFSQDFARARLPVCLHADGLRNQFTFFLNGWIAMPFVAVAKVRGVCR